MTAHIRNDASTSSAAPTGARRESTRRLAVAAALAGPLFYASAIIQMLTRPGFDLRVHPISQLSTGALGWIQIATFVLTGLGVIALAIVHRRVVVDGLGRRAAPLFIGIFGAGLIAAGFFIMDPQLGFPAGAPEGVVSMSWHSVVHSTAAALAFTALAVACIVLLVRDIRRRALWPAIGNGVTALVLLLPVTPESASVQVALTGVVAFTWTTVVALRLRRAA
ncbi:hypothetical protein ASE14_10290 [Agromyces sp. Root81]|uniref:DUF998 domain-containing protein n=1 Tax=Agromyces sp. Root81 TaxID=1736601 RepID=UPI0006F576A5|nr:DUF998 domain-containing protein [Agromyces sp. Root81]KRC61281.1 hypothetical protein ASE14_10290 [Agromyces sp. Root81]